MTNDKNRKPIGYWTDNNIIENLKVIINKLNHFPTIKELENTKRCDLSVAIGKHGGINKFKNIIGIKITKNTKGYWTEENVSKELKIIIEKLGHFPIQQELIELNRHDLLGGINKFGGLNKFRTLLGYNPFRKPSKYWNEKIIINEITKIKNQIGCFPSKYEIRSKCVGLYDAINKHGGINKYRSLCGENIIKSSTGYWTEELIIVKLKEIKQNVGHFPSRSEIKNNNCVGLISAIYKHGGFNKFRELLGDKIIKVTNGYWNNNIIINELKDIKKQLNHFPSYKELLSLNRGDLCHAIHRNGGIYKFQNIFNDVPKKLPNGYWNEEVIVQKLDEIINNIGHFPTSNELKTLKQTTLLDKIHKFGGVNKFRTLFKTKILRKERNYWNDNTIIENLSNIKNQIGHFPSNVEIIKMNRNDLGGAINIHGGYNKFRKIFGDELLRKPEGYWNDNTIIEELKEINKYLGHFPKQKEIKNMKKHGLNIAIVKHGGLNKFRKIFGLEPLIKPNNTWTENHVINNIKEIINKIGYFPLSEELKQMNRCDLVGAIIKFGGINRFRELLGYDYIQVPDGYWTEQRIINDIKSIIECKNSFPTVTELRNDNRHDLLVAIFRHGGINYYRKLLGYESLFKPEGYWNDETITKEIKDIISETGLFPTYNSLRIMDRQDLCGAITKNGNIDKYRKLMGYPLRLEEFNGMQSYVCIRGHKSEKEVKKILIKYCNLHNIPEPTHNKKLSKGNNIEFVFESGCGETIGIDVTNTKTPDGIYIRRKYIEKDYHKYLDKLWIVVLSDVFTTEDYIKFNKESPDNVEVMSVWDLIDTLQIDIDEYSRRKLEALETCTIRTKNDLINQLKNRTLTQYVTPISNNIQNIEI